MLAAAAALTEILDNESVLRATVADELAATLATEEVYAHIDQASKTLQGAVQSAPENPEVHLALAQLALANFPNEAGLLKYKGSTFVSFSSSGEPSIGTAGSGGCDMKARNSSDVHSVPSGLWISWQPSL